MRCHRIPAASAAAMLLVMLSACGDSSKPSNPSTDAGNPAKPSTAASQAKSEAAPAVGQSSIDVTYVRPEHFAAVIVHPRRIAQSPLVAEQLKDEDVGEVIRKSGLDPNEIEQVTTLFALVKQENRAPEPVPTVIVRFAHPVDAKRALNQFQDYMTRGRAGEVAETQVSGKTCYALGDNKSGLAYAPTPTTIILGEKDTIERIIAGGEPKGPLVERLRKAGGDCDALAAVALEGSPELLQMADAMKPSLPPQGQAYLDALKSLQGGTMTLNLGGPALVRLVLDAKDEAAADSVVTLLKQTIDMAKGGLAAARQSTPKEIKDLFDPAFKLAGDALEGTKAAKNGLQATLAIQRPENLDKVVGPAIENFKKSARDSAKRMLSLNNLRQVAMAMHMYMSSTDTFPPAAIEKEGKPLLSWRVAILPMLGEATLYRQFKLDEPWDSPHNLEAAKKMPRVYQSPDGPNDGKTRFMVFAGKGTAFDGAKGIKIQDIRDGSSNTILCVEAGPDKAVPWTKPEDLAFDPQNPSAALGQVPPSGFNAAFFDGHVQTLKVDDAKLKALITPAGGEAATP